MLKAEIVVSKDGKEIARVSTEEYATFAGFEGATREAAGQAVYEARVKVEGEEKQVDPQQPDAR